ncbi:TIGR03088 family PEP-CTERM/XrtA system glycosyltransferase [Neptunomonas qingdaonensis]|uniref:Sugar transferase, PEP-CTERM/EpsH1 system associated n=1 Tax=Neptunomonas qingdaonensis TaxID=1045558 RepID=A0A1I2MX15_9GAMM|nr:TIGR03088 family PEP-CTERM/XrtA system glycosyltransferase [Neptunomonas qingdaonensis]SFF95189.1 sugar transferase, PEP-CTERM/EpsH1 system associated [Neptunomonas qingdaonensis]
MAIGKRPALVVHIIYALGTGGLENGLVNIINRMPADRYRHVIICLTHATDFASRIAAPDVSVIELNKKEGHDLGVYWRLQKLLWKLKPDIVHTRNLAALEMQVLTLILPGVKRVHGEHGRDIYDLHGQNKKYNRLRKMMSCLIHRYIAVSQDLEGWLLETVKVPKKKIRQLYNGVDLTRFHQSFGDTGKDILPPKFADEDCLIIGTVGRVAAVKDQVSLINAFNVLVKKEISKSDKLRLVIVGDGPLYQTLKERVSLLGLESKVWLSGDRKDIPDLLRTMNIFVLPSLGEGISNTVLEAMATGLPIVATRVGGNPELVDDNRTGCLVPVGDVDELAKVLQGLIDAPEELSAMGTAGLEKVNNQFDWDVTVTNYLAVYDELLQ